METPNIYAQPTVSVRGAKMLAAQKALQSAIEAFALAADRVTENDIAALQKCHLVPCLDRGNHELQWVPNLAGRVAVHVSNDLTVRRAFNGWVVETGILDMRLEVEESLKKAALQALFKLRAFQEDIANLEMVLEILANSAE